MGKFDRYGDEPKRLGQTSAGTAGLSAVSRVLADAAARPRTTSGRAGGGGTKIAIALDATGSMANLISDAKKAITEIVTRASREAGRPIEIEILAYRDYDVPQQLLERSGVLGDPARLTQWLGKVGATGGGANDGEAIEVALAEVIAGDSGWRVR